MASRPEDKTQIMAGQLQNSMYTGYPNYALTQVVPQEGATTPPPAYNIPNGQQQTVLTINADDPCCNPPTEPVGDKTQHGELEDYYVMLPNIKIDFEGVFQERKDGCQVLSTYNSHIYNWTKLGMYVLFSCLLGPFMAFLFGMIFGVLEFAFVWTLNPFVKIIHMTTRYCSLAYRPVARMILDPIFESFGQLYRVRNSGQFTERKYKLDVTGIDLGRSDTSPHQHTA